MRYRFKRDWRQFKRGDPAPATYGENVCDAYVRSGVMELVDDDPAVAQPAKAVTAPSAHKMVRRPGRAKAVR